MRIAVTEESSDRLQRVSWEFYYADSIDQLRLVAYYAATRPTTRHKFQVDLDRSWSDKNTRAYRLKLADVPLPADLAERAKAELLRDIELKVTVDLRNAAPAPAKKSGVSL